MTACLLLGGPEIAINVGGAVYVFEMNDRCGPMPLRDDVGPKHEFWRVVSLWIKQGQCVEDGYAVWNEPREENRMARPREIKQCSCGEQMYRESRTEPWTCLPCELRKRKLLSK